MRFAASQCAHVPVSCAMFVFFFKEMIKLTIAVEATIAASIQAQQMIELVSGESTFTLHLEVAGLNGR